MFHGVHLDRHSVPSGVRKISIYLGFQVCLEIGVFTEDFPTLRGVTELPCTLASCLFMKGSVMVRRSYRLANRFYLSGNRNTIVTLISVILIICVYRLLCGFSSSGIKNPTLNTLCCHARPPLGRTVHFYEILLRLLGPTYKCAKVYLWEL